MTQQTQGDAVGGASDTVVAAEPTIEDRLSAAIDEQAEQPTKKPEEAEAPAAEVPEDLTVEDVAEAGEAEGTDEGAEKPIAPPVSWTAEEKAAFAELPPAAQKAVARREAERETFLQTKAQEAKQTRETVEREALQLVQQVHTNNIQALEAMKVQVPEKPGYQLQVDDPDAWAYYMQQHDNAVAHNDYVEQHIAGAQMHLAQIGQRQAQYQQQIAHQKAAEMRTVLTEKWPEFLHPETGPKLQQELGSIATDLGYRLDQADANDILAMQKVATYKSKADKYDALMAQKMERVRQAKDLPKVSRPGAAQPQGAAANARYQADREAMKSGDMQAAARAVARHI